MAIKPITEFNGDSWKKQKEESDRAHHYFKQFKKTHLSCEKFIQLLHQEADERYVKGTIEFWSSDKKFNKENQEQIQLYSDSEGKKGRLAKPCTVVDSWFDKHKWTLRRKDYRQYLDEDADESIRAMVTERKPKLAESLLDNIEGTLESLKQQREDGRLSLSQGKAGSESINTDIDSLNKLSNNDVQKVEANVTSDVNADVKVNKHSLSEDMILNPKYAELTKQLREEVLNGRTDSSEDT